MPPAVILPSTFGEKILSTQYDAKDFIVGPFANTLFSPTTEVTIISVLETHIDILEEDRIDTLLCIDALKEESVSTFLKDNHSLGINPFRTIFWRKSRRK